MQPNRIREHLPSHFEGFDLRTVEFTTVDELLAVPFVATWRHTPEFRRYCVWDRGRGFVMMFVVTAEGDGREKSWVIGHLDHDIPDLPRFQKPAEKSVDWIALPPDGRPIPGTIPLSGKLSVPPTNLSVSVLVSLGGSSLKESSPDVRVVRWHPMREWVDNIGHFSLGIRPTHWARRTCD